MSRNRPDVQLTQPPSREVHLLDQAEAAENRGAVQIHDPFLKRVLVEGMKDAWSWIEAEKLAVGCKDLGAGGLGGASSELVMAGGFGAEIDLERVPAGLPDLAPHELLCGETQERFVWAVPERVAAEFCAIWNEQYELARVYPHAAAAIIGRVIEEPVYRCRWRGDLVVELSNLALETLPQVARPMTVAAVREGAEPLELDAPRDWQDWAARRLRGWNAASRAPVYRFYDPEVQGLAFLRPGEGSASVLRPIPGEALGVAVSVDGNPHYGELDPYYGGALAVVESVRNVAATGARPLCLTDCLNFGNPQDPVALGELDAALRGMADACRAIGAFAHGTESLPVVSGNVSLYNFSAAGRSIPPSPIVACYGVLDDYGRALTPRLKSEGAILLVTGRRERVWVDRERTADAPPRGRVPRPELLAEAQEIRAFLSLAEAGLVSSAIDIADGGLLAALFEMTMGEEQAHGLSVELDFDRFRSTGLAPHEILASESPGFVLEVGDEQLEAVRRQLTDAAVEFVVAGRVIVGSRLRLRAEGREIGAIDFAEAHGGWASRLEALLFHRAEHKERAR